MTTSTLTNKHQTTIPKAVIEALKLKPADKLVYHINDHGQVILSARNGTFEALVEKYAELGKNRGSAPASNDEIDKTVRNAWKERALNRAK